MLRSNQFPERRMSLHQNSCRTQPLTSQINDDPIVASFYEERNKRSLSVKQHNLLKKNISYFKQLPTEQTFHDFKPNQNVQNKEQYLQSNCLLTPTNLQQNINIQLQILEDRPLELHQPLKKMTIKSYLSENRQNHHENKQNLEENLIVKYQQKLNSWKSQIQNLNPKQQKPSFDHLDSNKLMQSPSNQIYFKNLAHTSPLLSKNTETTNQNGKYVPLAKIINQNPKQSKSDSSETDQFINSPKFKSLLESSESRPEEKIGIKSYQHKPKCYALTEEEFTEYLELKRQKNNKKYCKDVDKEQAFGQFENKLREMQEELMEQREMARKEEKLIQSIFKMRRMLIKTEEDCSLKELWRWIKQLPVQNAKH